MGSIVGKAMDENMKKQQEFMMGNQRAMMERQLQMQNFMREQQMAMQLAKARDMFHYWAAFYGVALVGGIAGIMKKRRAAVIPLLPLTFIVVYQGDLAYGSKMHRIRAEAQNILQDEFGMLEMPSALPSVDLLDERRSQQK